MLGKLFGKKVAAAKAEAKKFENRDLMEAYVGGCVAVMYADGSVEDEELQNLEAQIAANPSMDGYGSEINQTIAKFSSMFDAGPRMGMLKVMREIADIKASKEEAEEVFVAMLTTAESDGDICDKELAVLKKVGQTLGINLRDYDLE
ncbi:tellurite resistance TerB family protein [Oceanimonas pelagia]|uniref:Tellurite resistance TerB family protein n=1 Tax=Oceanimonas pelagia TaxID=3028314 RepID=A0AA50KM91_9GAMM|nr:tellurite resistance TerB family protein [Oceanimonas pelagia]WMC09560.1 tellurite resistance TerB family protein [Oceanimonas pelagia]